MGFLDDLDAIDAAAADLRVAVIVPAAGRGERFGAADRADALGAPLTKIELLLGSRPVFLHALEAFCGRADVEQVILALAPDRLEGFNDRHGARLDDLGVIRVAGGTQDRWETVKNALPHVSAEATHIAVHDAARPLLSQAVIDRVFAAARRLGAAMPGLPVADTLVRVGAAVAAPADPADLILGLGDAQAQASRPVTGGVDRADLFAVQTPQVFEADLLRRAYARAGQADDPAAGATDDAARVAALGAAVHVVDGDPALIKLTRPADAELLAALLAHRAAQATRDAALRALPDDDDD